MSEQIMNLHLALLHARLTQQLGMVPVYEALLLKAIDAQNGKA